MKRGFQPVGDRPEGKRVRKQVTLPDGRVIEFEVFVIDKPDDTLPAMKAQPKVAFGGSGWVGRR